MDRGEQVVVGEQVVGRREPCVVEWIKVVADRIVAGGRASVIAPEVLPKTATRTFSRASCVAGLSGLT